MTQPQSLLDIEQREQIAVLRLNRPSKRNAINDDLIEQLGAFFQNPPEGVRCVVLHGEGEHFCAGLDLIELLQKRTNDSIKATRRSRKWHQVFDLMQHGELPIVSVLKGGVIGGGLEIASSTHVRVSEASTFYQLPEGQRGIFVGGGGSVRVPRIIGAGRVTEMMLTGRSYSAEEGLALGLAHYLVPDGEGLAKALELAATIAGNAPASNYAIINGISRISEMSTADGLFAESMVASMTRGSGEGAQRIKAFFDGRKADRES
jgi:enoyl-CoA hydratase/carnithine racemase